ncbi:MAG: sugar ABC transporter ATP-binding protein [Deltaproteobacteria bacterium]|nr:sugar ABC transporter ATP-binding protein [Deltaproteobacteria bacterium]
MSSPKDDQGNIVIKTERVSKSFPGVRALKELDFEVTRGEVHALCGENGAGKSTLMKTIVREYIEEEGNIFIEGQNVKDMGIRDVQELGLALIHQDLNLIPMISVAQNICLGREPVNWFGKINWKAMRKMASQFLAEVSTEIDVEDLVENLSISQQQLVAIARSLVNSPRILILDEPTARLDQKASDEFFAFLERAKEKKLTVVYISHRLEEIYRICDRITVLRDGRKITTSNTQDLPQTELVKHMLGREITQQVPKEKVTIGETRMSVRNLFPKERAEDINFELKSGEILGIVGSIGAGKSEVARAIFGADPRDSGDIYISGKKIRMNTPQDAIKHGLALIPEERRDQGLVGNESVRRNITLASLKNKFCSGPSWINQKKEVESVKELIATLGIATPTTEQEVQFLSGGTQQKVVVSKWLLSDSNIYIFDEPTKGIDVGGKYDIYKLIVDLARNGAGIIFISNELTEVLSLCDRALVMFHGRIIKELITESTNREEVLFYVMGGRDYAETANNVKGYH